MINKIQSTDNQSFKANLWLHTDTAADRKVYEEFFKRTKKYPKLILSQESVSKTDKDTFALRCQEKNFILFTDSAEYTKNPPKTHFETVQRLITIFNQLKDNAQKKGIQLFA